MQDSNNNILIVEYSKENFQWLHQEFRMEYEGFWQRERATSNEYQAFFVRDRKLVE